MKIILKIVKDILKLVLPKSLIKSIRNLESKLVSLKYKGMSNKEVFEKIYTEKVWIPDDQKKNFKYYSGLGSHEGIFTEKYIKEVSKFLKSFKEKPDVVELGCGDFQVSSNLINLTNKFIACDIFDELILSNKKRYNYPNVTFKTLDFTKDDLPDGEICIIRLVLQHLSNEMIIKFLEKIKNKYTYLIVTEHLPNNENFTPNLNIITGPNIRLHLNSGVDLTKEPFNLKYIDESNLCKISSKLINFTYLNTQLYKLK